MIKIELDLLIKLERINSLIKLSFSIYKHGIYLHLCITSLNSTLYEAFYIFLIIVFYLHYNIEMVFFNFLFSSWASTDKYNKFELLSAKEFYPCTLVHLHLASSLIWLNLSLQ